jgi:hypothetical protein
MLARLGRLDRVLRMQRIGRDDINHVNVGIVRHLFHRVVTVNIFIRQVVLRLPFFRLGGRTGDNAREPAEFCLLQCRCDLVRAQAAETDEGKAKFLARPVGAEGWRQRPDERHAGRGESGGLEEVPPGLQAGIHDAEFICYPVHCNRKIFPLAEICWVIRLEPGGGLAWSLDVS